MLGLHVAMTSFTARGLAVGSTIEAIRSARRLTRRGLAARTGLAESSFYAIERQGHDPRASTIARVAAALNVRIDTFARVYYDARPGMDGDWESSSAPPQTQRFDEVSGALRLGAAVAQKRAARGLSLRGVGDRIRMHGNQVSGVECGLWHRPQLRTLVRLSEALEPEDPGGCFAVLLAAYAGEVADRQAPHQCSVDLDQRGKDRGLIALPRFWSVEGWQQVAHV